MSLLQRHQQCTLLLCLLISLLLVQAEGFVPPAYLGRMSSSAVKRRCLSTSPLSLTLAASSTAPQRPIQAVARYSEVADDASWAEADEGEECTVERAMYCGLAESTDIAATLVTYMEECNEEGKQINPQAADVLRSLLSHQLGCQGFWTLFLTDPDLQYCTEAPYDPSLLSALARFPELNVGVLSSCLAMSATEETVYSQDGDAMMMENAALSRIRVLKLLAAVTRQPNEEKGEHGYNWLLDLIDYDLLMQCVDTAEMRGIDVMSGNVLVPATGIFVGKPMKRKMSRNSIAEKALSIAAEFMAAEFMGGDKSEESSEEQAEEGVRTVRKDIGESTRIKKENSIDKVGKSARKLFGKFMKFVDVEVQKQQKK